MNRLTQVFHHEIDITSGEIKEKPPWWLSVEEPSIRATLLSSKSSVACLQFQYIGVTTKQIKSKDGTEFHQIGLKLLAKDSCNLVYIMWRIHPKEELVVQVKRNLGQSKNSECKNNGYTTIVRHPFSAFGLGETHELMANILQENNGGIEIKVWVDWQEILLVPISKALIEGINGPPGIRTDNGQYDFRYFIASSDALSN
jgi:hypothetical protein